MAFVSNISLFNYWDINLPAFRGMTQILRHICNIVYRQTGHCVVAILIHNFNLYDSFYFTGPITPCNPSPCQNGGVCVIGGASFWCNCTNTAFGGITCTHGMYTRAKLRQIFYTIHCVSFSS